MCQSEWLSKFSYNLTWQLCQNQRQKSIATITGKCAWVTEQYQLQQSLASVPKWLSKKHQDGQQSNETGTMCPPQKTKFKSVLRAICQPTLAGFESTRIFHSNPDSHDKDTSYIDHHLVDWGRYCGTAPIVCTLRGGWCHIQVTWWCHHDDGDLGTINMDRHIWVTLMTSRKPPLSHPGLDWHHCYDGDLGSRPRHAAQAPWPTS